MSKCHVSQYAHVAPLLFPLLFIAAVVSSAIFKKGIIPLLGTRFPFINAPVERRFVQSFPIPPDHFASCALSPMHLKIWWRSSAMVVREQLLSCGLGVSSANG